MAFDISKVGGYGTGSLGNVVVPYDDPNNPYVNAGRVYPEKTRMYVRTYVSSPTGADDYAGAHYPENIYPQGLTVGGATLYLEINSGENTFLKVGSALLFVQMRHKDEMNKYGAVNANLSEEIINEYGKYEVRTITAINDNNYTLDQAPAMDFANHYVFIVPFLDFENLTLNSGGRLCMIEHEEGEGEEILAVRVKDTLTLNGGHIDLFSSGRLNGNRKVLNAQEKNGQLDADAQAGQENFITKDRFLLSGGQEGGLFLLAKNIVVTNADSRIGVGFEFNHADSPSDFFFIAGVQHCRGASDSPNRPTDLTITFPPKVYYEEEHSYDGVYATNKSGATILIACETFQGFTPALIAKYSMYQDTLTSGQLEYNYGKGNGLARCYIACKNPPVTMLHDEGLYALDVLTDNERLYKNRVFTFGNGSSGNVTNPTEQINSYAAISSINSAQVTLANISNGSCPFEVGSMVMIHATAKSTPPENVSYVTLVGAAALNNLHIQEYVKPSEDTTPSGDDDDPIPPSTDTPVTHTVSGVLIEDNGEFETINNTGSNVTISCDSDIYVENSGANVSIGTGFYSPTIYNVGRNATISIYADHNSPSLNNTGHDAIIEIMDDTFYGELINSGNRVSINGNGAYSRVENSGAKVTLVGFSGDVDNSGKNFLLQICEENVNEQDIYGFNETSTLSLWTNEYTTDHSEDGNDVFVYTDNGGLCLRDAETLSNLNIVAPSRALKSSAKAINFGGKALTAKADIVTIFGSSYTINSDVGNVSISGFDENSTLNVVGNFILERHGNDIIVGVSENDTPIIYTGDFSAIDFPHDSDFKLAKILTYSNGRCSLDTTFDAAPDDYYLQLISIPQYENFKLSTSYTSTPKFENGRGGICALAVSETCDLTGGKLNVENKGHGLNTGNELDGNAFMRNHLPLGNGHGSIFLLTKNLKMNSSTRIGATYSGAPTSNFNNYGGKRGTRDFGSEQGAHVLIVTDKITGLNDAAISTGGDGAGAGYCGNDGVSGAAFIYCNNTG